MSDGVTVKIEGLAQIEERLGDLSEKLARGVMRKALKAGGTVMQEAVKARAPRLTGQLDDDIVCKVTTSSTNETQTAAVGPTKHSYYGMFAEFGTEHEAARPWLRPAFDESSEAALAAFVEVLKEQLLKAEAK